VNIRIFVGTGGVGKTSVTAASALRTALDGEKCLVMTTDPALRLKTALGLRNTGIQQRVPLDPAQTSGELWAALLDVPATMDRLVRENSDAAKARGIIEHPIYKLLVTSLAGMNELIAVERINQATDDGFENLLIDTAPSRHTFEFLDKPEFFVELVTFPLVKLVGRTYDWWRKSPFSGGDKSATDLYGRLQQLLGATLVSQVLEFFGLFQPVAEAYARRSKQTMKLLRDPQTTSFTIVTSPAGAKRDSDYLSNELTKRGYSVERLILNRMWPELQLALSPGASPEVRDLAGWYESVCASQGSIRDRVHTSWTAKGRQVIDLPELSRDIDGVEALTLIAEQLKSA
jgi:anion-transporting  ArsA/GET3 family ATPase